MVKEERKRDNTGCLQFKCYSIKKYLRKNKKLSDNKRKFGFKIIDKILTILKKYSITEEISEKIDKIIKQLVEYLLEK